MPNKTLEALPGIVDFRKAAQSLAALDAIMSSDWESRYYSFDASWGDIEMAGMRDGCGDHWFAVFTKAGVALHGLAHESKSFEPGKPKPWVFANLPAAFQKCLLQEPAFDTSNSTYCIWRLSNEAGWSSGVGNSNDSEQDGGLSEHLSILIEGPSGYLKWAEEYYEADLKLADVSEVFRHSKITPELAARLNAEVDYNALQEDLSSIGYPSS